MQEGNCTSIIIIIVYQYSCLYIHKLDSINVGVVWGMVILIGGVVIKGYRCGLSLKQFWKSWSLCYCITITTGH